MRSTFESSPDVPMICPRCRVVYGPHKTFCPVDGARLTDRLEPDELAESPSNPACASVIAGRYELGPLIGHGSMARVHAARDLATGAEVAVKILSRRYAESEHERRRFFQEAHAALQISHPNVVKVLDVGRRVDGRPFIVIEHLHGESLGECLRRRRHLPIEIALPILRDAALGLAAVHEAGIVHRDVKPDNIFLVGVPDAPESVRLVDFGLAKLHAFSGHAQQSGTTLGTAAYMPPEQVLSEMVDARADIYSLGVVMFRTLTGHLPFEGQQDLDMLAQQVLLHSPPPSWLLDGLDPKVDAVVMRAIRKHPDNRYSDIACLADDIERVMHGEYDQLCGGDDVVSPDVYHPVTARGMETAMLFCKKLGLSPPQWAPVDAGL